VVDATLMAGVVYSTPPSPQAGLDYLFWISVALFVVALFALGAVKVRDVRLLHTRADGLHTRADGHYHSARVSITESELSLSCTGCYYQ
jgi:hypothetical protein